MVVRELTGGIYFGEPRGVETLADGSRKGVNTLVYTESGNRAHRQSGLRRGGQAG